MLSLMLHLHTNAHTHTQFVCRYMRQFPPNCWDFGLVCFLVKTYVSYALIFPYARERTCARAHTLARDSSVRQCATGQNKTLVSIGTHARAYVCMRVIMFLGHTIYHICFETRSFSNGGRLGGGICMTGSQAVGVYEQLRF